MVEHDSINDEDCHMSILCRNYNCSNGKKSDTAYAHGMRVSDRVRSCESALAVANKCYALRRDYYGMFLQIS